MADEMTLPSFKTKNCQKLKIVGKATEIPLHIS